MEERKEKRERQYKVYFLTTFSPASEGEEEKSREKETRTFREVGRKSIGLFVFIYFYIFLYIYIYIYII